MVLVEGVPIKQLQMYHKSMEASLHLPKALAVRIRYVYQFASLEVLYLFWGVVRNREKAFVRSSIVRTTASYNFFLDNDFLSY